MIIVLLILNWSIGLEVDCDSVCSLSSADVKNQPPALVLASFVPQENQKQISVSRKKKWPRK